MHIFYTPIVHCTFILPRQSLHVTEKKNSEVPTTASTGQTPAHFLPHTCTAVGNFTGM